MKRCGRCNEVKDFSEYNKSSSRKDGLNVYCKQCTRSMVKNSYWKDVDLSRKQCRDKNVKRKDKRSEYGKNYYIENKEKISNRVSERRKDPEVMARLLKYNRELERRRIKDDSKYRMIKRLRSNIKFAIKKYSEKGKTMSCSEYGIDFNDIFNKIGARPSNIYELDHIIPISKFNLDDPEQVKLANSAINLRWITSSDNKKKSNNIPEFAYDVPELVDIMRLIGVL